MDQILQSFNILIERQGFSAYFGIAGMIIFYTHICLVSDRDADLFHILKKLDSLEKMEIRRIFCLGWDWAYSYRSYY
jgi:hypothetical protein